MLTTIPPLVETFPLEAASLFVEQLRGRQALSYRRLAAAGLQVVSYGLHVALPDDKLVVGALPSGPAKDDTLTDAELALALERACEECQGEGCERGVKAAGGDKAGALQWLIIARTIAEILSGLLSRGK
jgi:hypothetical protein